MNRINPSEYRDIGRLTALAIVTGAVLLAFALGIRDINVYPIWSDELDSVVHMGAFNPPFTPAQVMQSLEMHNDDHVPLFFLSGSLWLRLAGWSQFSLRLMSCYIGVLMIACLFGFVTRILDNRTAALASLLMATNAFVILHNQEN